MMMSLSDAARLLNVDPQTVREHLNCKKIGRRVVVPRDEVLALVARPCGRTLAWETMRLWDVNERRPLCDLKADLLASTVTAFLLEHPEGDVRSDEFVRYAAANPPAGGGEDGNKLRNDIYAEAALRRLI